MPRHYQKIAIVPSRCILLLAATFKSQNQSSKYLGLSFWKEKCAKQESERVHCNPSAELPVLRGAAYSLVSVIIDITIIIDFRSVQTNAFVDGEGSTEVL